MHKRELIIIGSAYCSKLREQAGDGTQYMEEFRVLEEEFSCLDSVVMREAVQKKKITAETDSEGTSLPLAEGGVLDKSLF